MNDVRRANKILTQSQIELEIALFPKLEHIKYIDFIKKYQWLFSVSWLYTDLMRILAK